MEYNQEYYSDLISRYFFGETTEHENTLLATWLEAGSDNRKLFREYRKAWEEMERSGIESRIDVDKEWAHVSTVLEINEHPLIFPNRLLMRIAAIFVLVAIPGFLLYYYISKPMPKKFVASTGVAELKLPDGSDVTLNGGSILYYPSKFTKGQRNVNLFGEAWFDVARNETKPFIITMGKVRVEVLGTSFYVNTSNTSGEIEVILSSGKVSVYFEDKSASKVTLVPGEKALIREDDARITRSVNEDVNFLSWKTRKFIFSNDPMSLVIPTLNKVYQADLVLMSPALSDCRLTATFDDQSLESILNVLKSTLDLQINKTDTTIQVSGNGCK